ncbi:hypothetical protein [Sphingobium chlorophenolicum]|uniref:hypothetical protein n=1 Tax=Sphingobium chlorophenolicum TaxID=46429 RepID=UPI0002F1182E|nr:hypothetical protein [Sphingobium chlorophenolicum]
MIAIPYCGSAPAPAEWWTRWNGHHLLLAALALTLAFVLLRTAKERHWSGDAALVLFAFLYISPFCALGSALFSVRVLHHLLLMTVLAPLLAGKIKSRPGSLPFWTAAQAFLFWLWHWPAAYAAALSIRLYSGRCRGPFC